MTRTVFKCCKHNARAVISPSSTCPRREGDHLIGFERAAVCVKTTRQSCSGTDLWENITGNASSAGEPSAQKKKKKKKERKKPSPSASDLSRLCARSDLEDGGAVWQRRGRSRWRGRAR